MNRQSTEYIWLNGEVMPASQLVWPLDDRGLSLGDGLFETIRLQNGQPRFLSQHLARLAASALALQMPKPAVEKTLMEAISQLIAKNAITNGVVRLLFSRGTAPRGLALPENPKPACLVRVLSARLNTKPVRLALSKERIYAKSITNGHKTLSHMPYVMAKHELASLTTPARGDEALLLDHRGWISSASTANIFWVKKDQLYTPSAACGILPGTTRARVLEIAGQQKLKIKQGAWRLQSITQADAVFITNALRGVHTVSAIDTGDGRSRKFATSHALVTQLANVEAASG